VRGFDPKIGSDRELLTKTECIYSVDSRQEPSLHEAQKMTASLRSATASDIEFDIQPPPANQDQPAIDRIMKSEFAFSRAGIPMRKDVFNSGSEVELSNAAERDFKAEFGEIIFDGEHFWRFDKRCWVRVRKESISLHIQGYDGAPISEDDGEPGKKVLQLSDTKIAGAIRLWRARAISITAEKYAVPPRGSFFHQAKSGINCKSFFLSFENKKILVEKHHPNQRQRHVLDFDPLINVDTGEIDHSALRDRYSGSLLKHFVETAFPGEQHARKKWWVLFETMASAFCGYSKSLEFRHIVLLGPTANNGKSQALKMFYELVPEESRCSIEPQAWSTSSSRVNLENKIFNIVFDMSPEPIAGALFKTITAGEPLEARDLYESARDIRVAATHAFATNLMPSFRGSGFDPGVERRLAVINWPSFKARPIADLGPRIAREEGDLLITLIAEFIRRFARRGMRFVKPSFLKAGMHEWKNSTDAIQMFLNERTDWSPSPDKRSSKSTTWTLVTFAYSEFNQFCEQNGFGKMNRGTFGERLRQSGIEKKRQSCGVCFPFHVYAEVQ